MINLITVISATELARIQSAMETQSLTNEQKGAIASPVTSPYRVFQQGGETHHCYDLYADSVDQLEHMQDFKFRLVGIWDTETGKLLSEFDEALYLECLPDIIETDKDGNIISTTRPTEARDIHLRAGQAGRKFS